MRKLALAFVILALSASGAMAMDMAARTFYIHGIFSLPTGDFGDYAGNGFGGGVGISVPHNDMLNFRGEVGYIMFGKEDFSYGDYSWEYGFSMIPIVALAEYTFSPDTPVYGLGGVGLHILRSTWEGDDPFSDGTIDESDSETKFGFALGGGFNVNERFSVEGRYTLIPDSDQSADQLTINGILHF